MATTLPFIIKGNELRTTSSKPYAAQEVQYNTDNGGVPKLLVAEAWNTECQFSSNVHSVGVIFMSIGFSLLGLGLILELWARRIRSRTLADAERVAYLHESPADFHSFNKYVLLS